jgi:hypothetical protein
LTEVTTSSDEVAQQLAEAGGGLAIGINMFDVQRALATVLATGICLAANNKEEAQALLHNTFDMLRHQVSVDYDRIKQMEAAGDISRQECDEHDLLTPQFSV